MFGRNCFILDDLVNLIFGGSTCGISLCIKKSNPWFFIKDFKKILIFNYLSIFILFICPLVSHAVSSPEVFRMNNAFIIDNCKSNFSSNGDVYLKKCNFFVTNYADAALIIYDSNNNVDDIKFISGSRQDTSVLGSAVDRISGMFLVLTDEYTWNDIRSSSNGFIKKTTIDELKIPANGKLVLTKNSDEARSFNYLNIGIEAVNQIVPLEDMIKKIFGNKKFITILLRNAAKNYGVMELKWATSPADDTNDVKDIALATWDTFVGTLLDLRDLKIELDPLSINLFDQENLEKLNVLFTAAGRFAAAVNTIGQLLDMDRSKTNNTEIIVENNSGVHRFDDLPPQYYIYYKLLSKRGLSLRPKNQNGISSIWDSEQFGSDDNVDKVEFVNNINLIFKKIHKFVDIDSSKKNTPYTQIRLQMLNSSDSPVYYNQAMLLIDNGFKQIFGENYVDCINTRLDVSKAKAKVAQKYDYFDHKASSATINMYISKIIELNMEGRDPPILDRIWSLQLYMKVISSITRGKESCK